MRRALIALVATVAGVAWILGYKVEPHTAGIASAGPSATNSGPATTQPAPAPTTATGTGGISGTFTGADVPNRFGDVQVRVVISNGRITDLQAVQLPADRARSARRSGDRLQRVRPDNHRGPRLISARSLGRS